MANHKSAVKAHAQALRNRARNQARISRIKTFLKKFEEAMASGVLENATQAFRTFESEIMRGVSNGVYKLNAASRRVSSSARKLKGLETRS